MKSIAGFLFLGGSMADRTFLRIICALGLVAALAAAPASMGASQAGNDPLAARQPQAVPDWVTKGGAAFPELQKKGIFGRGKGWLDEFDSSDEARDEAVGMAEVDLETALLDLAAGIVKAYAGAVLPEPLDEWEELRWAANCRKRAIGVLSASDPPELNATRTWSYLDDKEGVWHALAWRDLSVDGFLVMELFAYEIHDELRFFLDAKDKDKKLDAKKAGELLYGALEAWAVKEGLSWRRKK